MSSSLLGVESYGGSSSSSASSDEEDDTDAAVDEAVTTGKRRRDSNYQESQGRSGSGAANTYLGSSSLPPLPPPDFSIAERSIDFSGRQHPANDDGEAIYCAALDTHAEVCQFASPQLLHTC
jgi:hypothetical protein